MSKDMTSMPTHEVGGTMLKVYPADLREHDSTAGLSSHARDIVQDVGESSCRGEVVVELPPMFYDPGTDRKTNKPILTESGTRFSNLIRPKAPIEYGQDKSDPSSINVTLMRGSRRVNSGMPLPSNAETNSTKRYLKLAATSEQNSSQVSLQIPRDGSPLEDPRMGVDDGEVQPVRRRGRPKGSKNKQAKTRPPPPPRRRRGRPRKTDPPVQIPVLEFPNRRQSTRISQRRSLPSLLSERTFVHSAERSSHSNLNVSLEAATSLSRSAESQSYSLSTRRSRSSFQLRSSSLMSGLDRAPLQPPENIFEDSNSSD